ncbi:hypothetical protein [Porphyromonas sp.]|uniref:hypothetical protein n=1 Tax=Porphyromonas sp. TaxID=1924944 RepID=UPI0026DD1034|nr:hypothetical protein [Porphyromonas sp.]MDO4771370.1 hypothetical protein [Porphyromonas sp.]
MSKNHLRIGLLILLALSVSSCGEGKRANRTSSETSGETTFAGDSATVTYEDNTVDKIVVEDSCTL